MDMRLEVEVWISPRSEEPLSLMVDIATGDLDGEGFELLQGATNPLEWRVRTREQVATFGLMDLIEQIVRRM